MELFHTFHILWLSSERGGEERQAGLMQDMEAAGLSDTNEMKSDSICL